MRLFSAPTFLLLYNYGVADSVYSEVVFGVTVSRYRLSHEFLFSPTVFGTRCPTIASRAVENFETDVSLGVYTLEDRFGIVSWDLICQRRSVDLRNRNAVDSYFDQWASTGQRILISLKSFGFQIVEPGILLATVVLVQSIT